MMRTKGLLLLCLFAFISCHINAKETSLREVKSIKLDKRDSGTVLDKGQRSVTFSEVFAYLDLDSELISIDLKNADDINVSVTNLFTDEILLSEVYSTPEIILNLAGLLNEGDEYRLEITIGETVFYGDFIY